MVPTIIDVQERVRLRVCKTEKFKAETFSMSAAIPLTEDRYLTTLLFSVLRRGCARYPTQAAINRRLDYLYGAEISVRDYSVGETHVIGLYADFVSASYLPKGSEEVFSETLALMRDLLFFPCLDENGLLDARYVESEKRLQCDAIRAKKNSPRAYAFGRCTELMLSDSPMGLSSLGTLAEVEAVTPERLTAHWRALLKNMRLDCFYVGESDGESVARLLSDTLGDLLLAPVLPCTRTVFASPRPAREVSRYEESLPVTQGQLVMGLRFCDVLGGRRYYAAMMLCELLGSSPLSKLFVNVRERLGLCYFCYAIVSRYAGVAFIRCGLDREQRDTAEREILAQIKALANGEITETEWEAARTSLVNSLRQQNDSPSAIDIFHFSRVLAGMDPTPDAEQMHLLDVSRAEVAALACELSLDTVFFLNPTRAGEEESDEDEEN